MRKLFGILMIAVGLLILAGVLIRVLPFPTQMINKTIALDNPQNINVKMNSENVQIIPEQRKDIEIELQKKRLQDIQIVAKKSSDGIDIGIEDKSWPGFLIGVPR
jgi:preprotein translocase subunit SecF